MRNFDDRIENSGATAPGRLSAAEDNVRFKEMENFVSTAGITLDVQAGPDTDFTMLAQAAARYASGGIRASCSGAANTYVGAATGSFVVPKALFDGMILIIKPSAANTGASTLNAFTLGSKAVRTWDDQPLIGGELALGMETMLGYSTAANSGAGAWLILPWCDFNSLWIRSDTTYTVGSGQQFATLAAAVNWLRYKLIAPDATVTLSLTAAQHTIAADINIPHLNGGRLVIKGQNLSGAFPTQGSLSASAATSLATLRGVFTTELLCSSGINGIVVSRNSCVRIENLLITGTSTTAAGIIAGDTAETALSASLIYGPGSVTAKNVWCHGHGTNVACRQGGFITAEKLGASHANADGVLANNGSYLNVQGLISCRNGGTGLTSRDSARAEITGVQIHNNAGAGVTIAQNGSATLQTDGTWNTIQNNTGLGVNLNGFGVGYCDTISFANSNNGGGSQVTCQVQSRAGLPSCTGITTISPAANTNGNQNSYIWA